MKNKPLIKQYGFFQLNLLRSFLFICLLIICFTFFLIQFLLLHHHTDVIEDFKQNAEIILNTEKISFIQEIKEIRSDLLFLARQVQIIENSLKDKLDNNLTLIENSFFSLSLNKKRYDQIRYLNEYGDEKIRINNII